MSLTAYYLDGVYLALGATPNAVALVDAPRCEMIRAMKTGVMQDRMSDLVGEGAYAGDRRLYTVDWRFGSEIRGVEEKIRKTLRTMAGRYPDQPIFILRGLLSLLVNTDLEGIVAELKDRISNPLLIVEHPSLDDDWIDGYRQFDKTVTGRILADEGSDEPLVSGFGLFRLEGDELGNVGEIRRIMRALGLPEPRWPMNGDALSLAPIRRTAPRLVFPYSFDYDRTDLPENAMRVPLPIGMRDTVAFVKRLGELFNREEEAGIFIEKERARIKNTVMKSVFQRLAGRGAVVIGDPWRSRGFCRALREFGMEVSWIASLRNGNMGFDGREELEAEGAEILLDPDQVHLHERLFKGAESREIDVVVGSGLLRDAARAAGLAYVETGYPAFLEHFLTPAPVFGFEGVARLAERLDNAIAYRDYLERGKS